MEQALAVRASHVPETSRSGIARALVQAGDEFDVDPLFLLAVAEEESRVRPDARSRRNALGLMQIRPVTARAVALRYGILWREEGQLFDPTFNARIGAAYLAELHERFDSWDLALTAYSHGPRKARQLRDRDPSSRYAAGVLRRYDELTAFR